MRWVTLLTWRLPPPVNRQELLISPCRSRGPGLYPDRDPALSWLIFYLILNDLQVGGVSRTPCDFVFQTSAVLRASRLPLFRSALQSVTSVYSEAKGRYRLLGLVGSVAEVGVRRISDVAMRQASPILQTLEPQSRSNLCFCF